MGSWLKAGPSGTTTSEATIAGRPMTRITYADGGPDDYIYGHGDVVFDIEAVFMYPWAVALVDLGWPGYVTMAVFGFTLILGLVYVWKKGALDWSRE